MQSPSSDVAVIAEATQEMSAYDLAPRIKYLAQTVDDIRLYLVSGDFSREQFTVLASDVFEWQDLQVSFGILGESHYVSFAGSGSIFTEICACTSASFDKSDAVLMSDFLVNLKRLPIECAPLRHSYAFAYECLPQAAGIECQRLLKSKRRGQTVRALRYEFPEEPGSSINPVTEIHVESRMHELCIDTVHTYPNAGQMVFTTRETLNKPPQNSATN